MSYQLNLNLRNLEIKQSAKFVWSDPSSAVAHEGFTLTDGTQVPGFPWIDRTIERVDLPDAMKAQVKEASTLDQAFKQTAEVLSLELKSTLEQAPDSNVFDYQKIKDSQSLNFG